MTATARFTGDANPYGGGDPYADYRTADLPFTGLVDLADRRLGAGVIAANDEFFAERENLLKPEPAQFDPERFGHKGQIMDGVLPRTRLQPDTNHRFVLPDAVRATHVRIDIFPDGGISRLRLFGSPTEEGATRLAARHRELGG
ncbi:hypothetical protein [Streptomyces sp. NBC_01618]|uniref:hypothetical protein n=1 Tax=Streptomyces sp. NBC_01618 TaxID=2975900 RepID=UPI0038694452|nr:hypothetical protein OH735_30350 [Streptomyces sp. NBC_01618]